MFSEEGRNAPKLNAFVGRIEQGQPADEAFAVAIGDIGAYERAFANYVNRSLFSAARIGLDVNLDRARFPARKMAPVETAVAKASFHVALGRTVEARALIDQASALDPSSPLPVAVPRARDRKPSTASRRRPDPMVLHPTWAERAVGCAR